MYQSLVQNLNVIVLLYMMAGVFSELRPGVGVCDEVFEPFGEGIDIALGDEEAAGVIISRDIAQGIYLPFS